MAIATYNRCSLSWWLIDLRMCIIESPWNFRTIYWAIALSHAHNSFHSAKNTVLGICNKYNGKPSIIHIRGFGCVHGHFAARRYVFFRVFVGAKISIKMVRRDKVVCKAQTLETPVKNVMCSISEVFSENSSRLHFHEKMSNWEMNNVVIWILASGIKCWNCEVIGEKTDDFCNDPFDAKKLDETKKAAHYTECDKTCGKIVGKKDCMYFEYLRCRKLKI